MDGTITIGTEIDTITVERQIELLEDKLEGLVEEYDILERAKPFEGQQRELIKLGNEIDTTRKKVDRLRESQKSVDFSDMGKNLQGVVKHVGRWAIAIFGIRSAYNFIRQSMSILAEENDMLNSKITTIRNALAQSVAPIVEYLVNLAYRLVTYLGYIIKAWTGRDIFAKSSKSASSTVKSAQKLQKTMAGFDEMNVVNDSSSSGGGGGGGGASLPTPEDVPIPGWVKWIAENGGLVASIIGAITGALVGLKLGLDPLMSLGIGAIVGGIILLVQDIIKFIKDPTWQNFVNILGDIAIIIGGIMLVMGNWWGLLVIIVGLAVKLIVNNWDTISKVLSKIGKWIYDNVLMPTWEFLKAVVTTIWNFIKGIVETIWSFIKLHVSFLKAIFTTLIGILTNPFKVLKETVTSVFNGIKTAVQGVFNVIKGLFSGDWKQVMSGFKQIFKGAFDSLVSIAKTPLNLIIGALNSFIKGINKIKFDVPDWVPIIGGKKWGFNIKTIPKLAQGGIVNNPGRGVPIGGAIAGEKGSEGVIPLSNSQAMEQLGSAIGRYITVNLTNETKLDGRTIARKVSQLTNNDNFLRNR